MLPPQSIPGNLPVNKRKISYQELSSKRIKRFYDQLGARQDKQAFYEDPAIHALLQHSFLKQAHAVFEFGVGTGRLAERMLTDWIPEYCLYRGVDMSTTMVQLAQIRLKAWEGQSEVLLTDGSVQLPVANATFDRFVSTYVFEILSEEAIKALLQEVKRILTSHGMICLVNLTFGHNWYTRLVSSLWSSMYRVRPLLVGGCRPIQLLSILSPEEWQIQFHTLVTAYGITSEVIVAKPRSS